MDRIRTLIRLVESPLTTPPQRLELLAELEAAYLERLAEAQAATAGAPHPRQRLALGVRVDS